jgi:hypothetical protein
MVGSSDPAPASILQGWGVPSSPLLYPFSISGVCEYPIHRVMVNWDPPISPVIHLPGAIQKGNTSTPLQYTVVYTGILTLIEERNVEEIFFVEKFRVHILDYPGTVYSLF